MQQTTFHSFCEERPLERVRGAGDQHQNIEERERHRNAPRPHASNANRVRQCPNQMNDERETTDDDEIDIHAVSHKTLIVSVRTAQLNSLSKALRWVEEMNRPGTIR